MSSKKKRILDKLFWEYQRFPRPSYSFACENCHSIVLLSEEKEDFIDTYEERTHEDSRYILRKKLFCCNNPKWYFSIVDVKFPNKIYYWDDIKGYFKDEKQS